MRPVVLTALGGIVLSAALALSAAAQTPDTATATPTSRAQPAPMNVRTTRDLVALCGTPDTDPNYPNAVGLCVGYGSGVLDYHLADTYRHKKARKVCFGQQPPTRGEAREKFVAWAQANPQYMDEPAVNGVMRFLITTYPCTP